MSATADARFAEDALRVLQRALQAAEAVIEEACDELRCDDAPLFAPMGTDDVEKLHDLLAGVLVEIHDALLVAEGGVR